MEINFNPECCRYCSNNPLNNPYASGICCCSLPYQTTTNIKYQNPEIIVNTVSTTIPKEFL